jgi:hypothetical protein
VDYSNFTDFSQGAYERLLSHTVLCCVANCSDPTHLISLLWKRVNILLWLIACNHAMLGSSIDS